MSRFGDTENGIARWQLILGVVGTTAALLLVLALVDWHALAHAWSHLSNAVLLAAAAASVLTTLLLALRWVALVAATPGSDRHKAFRQALIGQSFNAVTPAAVGGDAYRVAVARNFPGGRSHAIGLVILERLIGVAAFAIAYLIAFAMASVGSQLPPVFAAAAIVLTVPATFPILILALARLRPQLLLARLLPMRLQRVTSAVAAIEAITPTRLLAVLGLSLAGAVSWLICVGVLAQGAGVALSPETVASAVVITEFARLLPISIQGIGVREATFAWLVLEAGGNPAPAVVACATAYALNFTLVTVVALIERAAPAVRDGIRIGGPMNAERERENGI